MGIIEGRVARAFLIGPAIAGLACVLLCAAGSAAQERGRVEEYQVKASFLVNFAKFVTWPSSEDPLVLAIVGVDPFGPYLDTIVRGKAVNGRRIEVRRLQAGESLEGCQIAFVSVSESARTAEILSRRATPRSSRWVKRSDSCATVA